MFPNFDGILSVLASKSSFVTHLFCVVKNDFAFSLISIISSSSLPPTAFSSFVTFVNRADEFPAFGSEINVKVLKCTEVVAANRRKDMRRGDGSTTTFSLPFNSTTTPKDIGYHISVNGKVLRDNEFSINTAGTVVTFSTAPANDAFIEIVGIFDITTFAGSSSDTDLDIRKKVFDCDGVRQLFDLGDLVFERHAFGTVQDSYNEQKLLVFINGELQSNDKYIIVGSRLYMTTVPGGSDVLEVIRFI